MSCLTAPAMPVDSCVSMSNSTAPLVSVLPRPTCTILTGTCGSWFSLSNWRRSLGALVLAGFGRMPAREPSAKIAIVVLVAVGVAPTSYTDQKSCGVNVTGFAGVAGGVTAGAGAAAGQLPRNVCIVSMLCNPTTESTMPLRAAGTCAGWVLAKTVRVGAPFGPETWYCHRLVLNAASAAAAVPYATTYWRLDGADILLKPIRVKYDSTA